MLGRLIKLVFLILDFPLGWIAVLGIALLDELWASNTSLSLPSPWLAFVNLLFFTNVKILYHALIVADVIVSQRYISFFKSFLLGIEFILLCWGGGHALAVLSYLTCTLGYPLVDQQFLRIDQAIGFHWDQIFQWSFTQPIKTVLLVAYVSIIPQLIFFGGWFAFLGRKDHLHEMFWVLFVSLFLSVVISGFLPALGPAITFGLNWIHPQFSLVLSDITLIRSGISPEIHKIRGIVTFPSFHTVSAIVYAYGFRKSGRWGIAIFLLNIVMLLSIPAFGDHYLVDMLAGAVVFLISITVVRICTQNQRGTQ